MHVCHEAVLVLVSISFSIRFHFLFFSIRSLRSLPFECCFSCHFLLRFVKIHEKFAVENGQTINCLHSTGNRKKRNRKNSKSKSGQRRYNRIEREKDEIVAWTRVIFIATCTTAKTSFEEFNAMEWQKALSKVAKRRKLIHL